MKRYNARMHSHTPEELRALAATFVEGLLPVAGGATIVTLSGDLGAGKTTFAQGIATALGITEQVTSPTFIIENIYALEGRQWERFIHIDAYRLKGAHELEVLGWQEIVADPKNLIVLEWPEQVSGAIPERAVRLKFEIEGDARRIVQE